MLIDSFGRKLDYLRISVTDRCNLRCVYCMPADGVESKNHDSMLRFEEVLRLSRIMVELGIRKVRVTGGEPLVRRGIPAFLQSLKTLKGIESLTLTTNGILLAACLGEIANVLDGVNISLDALDPEKFAAISRHKEAGPGEIISVIDRLLEKNINVKINCVPIRGFNEEEIIPLAALAKDRNIAVRFIELMPLGSAAALELVPGGEVASLLEKAYGAAAASNTVQGNGPALYYSFPGFAGKIGFINPLSHGFCDSCNRLRLTSDGILKLCLARDEVLDLKGLLRDGISDMEISAAIKKAAAAKPRYHDFLATHGDDKGAAGRSPAEEGGGPHSTGMFKIGG